MCGPFRFLALAALLLAAAGCDAGDADDNNNGDPCVITNDQLEALASLFNCDVTALRFGDPESGSLSSADCTFPSDVTNQSHIDYYGFCLSAPADVVVTMETSDFEPQLWYFDEDGRVLYSDTGDEEVVLTLSLEAGVHVVGANSNTTDPVTGSYTIELTEE
ncbi:MAG TPA: hypothetical protein VD962_13345 [Rubricoccaceae bacterium]|nr:hypothetical protein [Rubricoccaceae bacterium]